MYRSQLRVQNSHIHIDYDDYRIQSGLYIFLKGKYVMDLSYFRVCWFPGRLQTVCADMHALHKFVFHRSVYVSCGLAFTVQASIKSVY